MDLMGNSSCWHVVRQRVPWLHQQEDDEMNGDGSPPSARSIIRKYSVETEVPDNTITNLFPIEDNYVIGRSQNSRSPKSLKQLALEQVCRSLPLLEGELPPGLPQDLIDSIVTCLLSHSALNQCTLRALRNCEVHNLSLASCRGVSDDWLRALNQENCLIPRDMQEHYSSNTGVNIGMEFAQCTYDRDECTSLDGDGHASGTDGDGLPLENNNEGPPLSPLYHGTKSCHETQHLDDDSPSSSCSSSTSFVSASSTPLAFTPPTKKSYLEERAWTRDISTPPPLPQSSPPTPRITSNLTSLDLRGSQRLTDRGLLQLHSLHTLEVARLDHCHSIVGKGLIAFASSYRLRTLSLANCRRLSDEAIINVSHLKSLETLSLDGCRCLTDRSLEAISNLVNMQKLDLSQCDLITDEGLENLNALSLIEELSLGWCRSITDDGIETLVSQPMRRELLKVLRLARCPITDVGVGYVGRLKALQELDLNGCTRIGSAALGETLGQLLKLTSLDVSYCRGILRLSWQGKIQALKSLELCYSDVRDSHLSRLTYLPMLEELNFDSCPIGDWSLAHLADNGVVPNLTALDLADTDVSDMGMVHIAKFTKMRKLSLFYCNITNAGLRHLSTLTSLEELNLDSRDVGDQGLYHLQNLSKLRALDIFSGRITDYGCIHLSKIKSLESLELCGGGIGDRGCAYLASLENLSSLNLSQNERITNRGAAALAALSKLKALNLSNTRVDSGAMQFLGSLVHLQSLALYGCEGVDDRAVSTLQNELPSLKCLRLHNENLIAPPDDPMYMHESSDEDEDASFQEDGEVMANINDDDGIAVDDQSDAEQEQAEINLFEELDNNDDGSSTFESDEDLGMDVEVEESSVEEGHFGYEDLDER
mmetsp:Transcript_13749/g.21014  ORF Transcript_13749/g.21014 Transcript_13749/m.21014 type:complete len:879 (-) Transcript_13749:1467-4103(-)